MLPNMELKATNIRKRLLSRFIARSELSMNGARCVSYMLSIWYLNEIIELPKLIELSLDSADLDPMLS